MIERYFLKKNNKINMVMVVYTRLLKQWHDDDSDEQTKFEPKLKIENKIIISIFFNLNFSCCLFH